jgi:hypothetical protein
MSEIFLQVASPDGRYVCIIEDNGVVAYAYLMQDKKILSDLWLYNQAATPEFPEWKNRTSPPFLNSAEYVDEHRMSAPIMTSSQVRVDWHFDQARELVGIEIWLHGIHYGRLTLTSKPGATLAAKKDGPLAKRF